MRKIISWAMWLVIIWPLSLYSQSYSLIFLSDTQAPMAIEKVILKSNQNVKATAQIFAAISKEKPSAVYLLGDVVSLGHKENKWKNMDIYLTDLQKQGITIHALLGNHDVMSRPRKGEGAFQKRFPKHDRLGYVSIVDSVAVIMLNSNFKKLTATDIATQQLWLEKTILSIDQDPSIITAIFSCHHAPFTNSKIVKPSKSVQEFFVDGYLKSKKGALFLTGHSHNFEHFKIAKKDFMVIGGGGGLRQPLKPSSSELDDLAKGYKPEFHFLTVDRRQRQLFIKSTYLSKDFKEISEGYKIQLSILPN